MFGPGYVSSIHGRLLTAWSVAGLLGPLLVTYITSAQRARGVPDTEAYSTVLYVMAALLAVGFVANLLIRPVAGRHFDAAAARPATPDPAGAH